MVKIRLARFGKKKQPTYRLVVSDARKDTLGTYIESVGTYNPSVNPKVITINQERIKHWLSVGAQASPTVHNLLVSQGVIKAEKIKASKTKVKAQTEDSSQAGAAGESAPAEVETKPAENEAAPEPAADEKPEDQGTTKTESTEAAETAEQKTE